MKLHYSNHKWTITSDDGTNHAAAKRRKVEGRAGPSLPTVSPLLKLLRDDELLLEIMGFLPAEDLLTVPCVCQLFSRLNLEASWHQRYVERWQHNWNPSPHDRVAPYRLDKLQAETCLLTWKERYWLPEMERRLSTIRKERLEDGVRRRFDGGKQPMEIHKLGGELSCDHWFPCSETQYVQQPIHRRRPPAIQQEPLTIYRVNSGWVLGRREGRLRSSNRVRSLTLGVSFRLGRQER